MIKKRLFSTVLAATLMAAPVIAQTNSQFTVPEPEFINSYVHVSSNENYSVLPKEHGEIKEHKSKWATIADIGSTVASVGMAAAGVAVGFGGTADAVIGGIRTMGAASSVGSAASAISTLAGLEGKDIVFKGKNSAYIIPKGNDVNIIYKERDNETDPQDMIRVVKFNVSSKDRRVRWFNYSVPLLATKEAQKNGYIPFTAKKYGSTSYLITILASQLEKGEYGIVVGMPEISTVIPIATFSIQ